MYQLLYGSPSSVDPESRVIRLKLCEEAFSELCDKACTSKYRHSDVDWDGTYSHLGSVEVVDDGPVQHETAREQTSAEFLDSYLQYQIFAGILAPDGSVIE